MQQQPANPPVTYSYDAAAELTRILTPAGLELDWTYSSFTFQGNITQREIKTRTLAAGKNATPKIFTFTRPSSDSHLSVHSSLQIESDLAEETFSFETQSLMAFANGKPLSRQVHLKGSAASFSDIYTWNTKTNPGQAVIQSIQTTTTHTGTIPRTRLSQFSSYPLIKPSTASAAATPIGLPPRVQCEVVSWGPVPNCGVFGPQPGDPTFPDPSSGDGSNDDTNFNYIYGGTQTIEVRSGFEPVPVDNAPLKQTLDFTPGLNFSGDFLYINGVFTGVTVPAEQMNSNDLADNLLLGSTVIGIAGDFIGEGLSLDVAEETAIEQIALNKAAGDVAEKAVFESEGIVADQQHVAIDSLTGTAARRYADFMTNSVLGEVKNYTTTLRFTRQLEDFLAYANRNNLTFELWTRSNTPLSLPLATLIGEGVIVHKIIPGT